MKQGLLRIGAVIGGGRVRVYSRIHEDPLRSWYTAVELPSWEMRSLIAYSERAQRTLMAAHALLLGTERYRQAASPLLPALVAAGVDEESGRPWVCTASASGYGLQSLVKSAPSRSGAETMRLLDGIASALAALHRVGLAHRALSPDHIYYKAAPGEPPEISAITGAVDAGWLQDHGDPGAGLRSMFGDLGYVAPEILAGARRAEVGPASDVYSFGLVAFYLLSGEEAVSSLGAEVFASFREKGDLRRELDKAVDRARALQRQGRAPAGFDEWLARCLADASNRPSDILAVAAELRPILEKTFPRPEGKEPAAAGDRDDRMEVAPDVWLEKIAERLPQPVVQSRRPDGFVVVTAGPAGAAKVEIWPGSYDFVAGGVQWSLPGALTKRSAREVFEVVARTARLSAEAEGGGSPALSRKDIERMASEEGGFTAAPDVQLSFGARELVVARTEMVWVTSHDLEPRATPVITARYACLPRDRAEARALIQAFLLAAGWMGVRPLYLCSYCAEELPSQHMHNKTTCHSCAEAYLGVIH